MLIFLFVFVIGVDVADLFIDIGEVGEDIAVAQGLLNWFIMDNGTLIFVERMSGIDLRLGWIKMILIFPKRLIKGRVWSLTIKRGNEGVPIHGIIIHWNIITQSNIKIRIKQFKEYLKVKYKNSGKQVEKEIKSS